MTTCLSRRCGPYPGNFREPATYAAFSRVVEIDPQTAEVTWQYKDTPPFAFYSPFMGSAQRLPNGNTHVTESAKGRLFEITRDGEVVWEYVLPWFGEYAENQACSFAPGVNNGVFATFRYSAEEVPWLGKVKTRA